MTPQGARGGAVPARVGPYPGGFQGVRCFPRLGTGKLLALLPLHTAALPGTAATPHCSIPKALRGIFRSISQEHLKEQYRGTTDVRCAVYTAGVCLQVMDAAE